MIRVGVIGYGYWGPNLVRNFFNTENCQVVKVADSNELRATSLQKNFPSIPFTTHPNDIISDPQIDAVAIATPVFTHYELAKSAIEQGKNVLLEKPMTSTLLQAEDLIELAERKHKLLMVDHTFLYTGSVRKIKELICNNEIGNIRYFDSTRINLGLFQPDINVLWDLAPHDLSILNYMVNERPDSVHATGVSHTKNGIENIAYLTLNYASGFIAHFNCSWTSPVKIRLILIGGDKKMVAFNDLEPSEKVKIYDTSYAHKTREDLKSILVEYRTGDIYIPNIPSTEALSLMASDFINCIIDNKKPVSDCYSGLDVVRILEAAEKSLKDNGSEIKIK